MSADRLIFHGLCTACGHAPTERNTGEPDKMGDWTVCFCPCHGVELPKLQPIVVIPLPFTLAEEIRRELDEAGMIDCDVSNSDVDAVIARVLIRAGKQEVQT